MTSADSPKRPSITLSHRARLALPVVLVALVVASVHRLVCAEVPPREAIFSGQAMGTTWSVTIADPLATDDHRRIQHAIEAKLEEVNALMSTYRADSELSRFNRAEAQVAFPVSPPTLEVFRIAREVSERSDGAFDVTVDPLVAAWGFGATDRPQTEPTAAELAALRERVGFRWVEIDPEAGTLRKLRPGVTCDLSGVAKGYAVDRVAADLADRGFANYLVEVGGEVRGRGRRLDGAAWRVAIERPESSGRAVFEIIGLADQSLATSGDYRNFFEKDGRRFSHTIDPRTGRPIQHRLASVSVIHPESAYADAWATALTVLGEEAGLARAEREGLAVFFIVRHADGSYHTRVTSAFEPARERGRKPFGETGP